MPAEPSFKDFKKLPKELQILIVSKLGLKDLPSYGLTHWEGLDQVMAISKIYDNIGDEHRKTMSNKLYESMASEGLHTTLQDSLDGTQDPSDDNVVSGPAYRTSKIVGLIANDLSAENKRDYLKRLDEAAPTTKQSALYGASRSFGTMEEPFRSEILGRGVDLLASPDSEHVEQAAQFLAKNKLFISPELGSRIKSIRLGSKDVALALGHHLTLETRSRKGLLTQLNYKKPPRDFATSDPASVRQGLANQAEAARQLVSARHKRRLDVDSEKQAENTYAGNKRARAAIQLAVRTREQKANTYKSALEDAFTNTKDDVESLMTDVQSTPAELLEKAGSTIEPSQATDHFKGAAKALVAIRGSHELTRAHGHASYEEVGRKRDRRLDDRAAGR